MTKKNKTMNNNVSQNNSSSFYNNNRININNKLPENIDYFIKPNLNLVKNILNYRRHSKSQVQETFITEYLIPKLKKISPTIELHRDTYGNLYATHGKAETYPCLVAHLDINQATVSNAQVIISSGWILGFDADSGEQCGLGADDGIGISLALEILQKVDNLKIFFPKDEEIGCIGSSQAVHTFFENCTMILQGDRRSFTNDLITFTNGIKTCSIDFVTASMAIMNKYCYKENTGVSTDIGALKKNSKIKAIACNVSVGYFNEHSKNEVISIKHYTNAINFVYELITQLGDTIWEHINPPPVTYNHSINTNFNNNTTKNNLIKDYVLLPESKLDIGYDMVSELTLINYERFRNKDYRRKHLAQVIRDEKRKKIIVSTFTATQLDTMLKRDVCPCCLKSNSLIFTNTLLIEIDCDSCGSIWNTPVES